MPDNPQTDGKSEPKRNCWEVMKCGRQPGGRYAAKNGICPAATDQTFDGINAGKCGGRICWAVAGTFCEGCVMTWCNMRISSPIFEMRLKLSPPRP